MDKVYHSPIGDPCTCGIPNHRHYVAHKPDGDPCSICNLPIRNHRNRAPAKKRRTTFIGIDGEGWGTLPHNYVLMGACSENGEQYWVEPSGINQRLTTVECLEFLLSLPSTNTKLVTFSFNYDLTKLLEDCTNEVLYKLFRPEKRQRKHNQHLGPRPVYWNGYLLNYQGTKFSVKKNGKKRIIWDLFKFFQGKFVKAIKDWKVGNEELWARIEKMKDQRGTTEWGTDPLSVRRYCLEECLCIAQLGRKLVEAHESVDLELSSFYGAGSSGSAMLKSMGIKGKNLPPIPEMMHAVECSFSGGRFEHSAIGPILEPLDGWDISSAYPYQMVFLPCLEHGNWVHTKRRKDLEKAENSVGVAERKIALVKYGLGPSSKLGFEPSWGPFPFRTKEGSICYPIESGGGWIWLDEYLAGEKIFKHVQFKEAWIYKANCDCKPFARIPEYYLLRLKLGKEGPGLAIKLCINSCYGKLAQSLGQPIYNSWIWASLTTSGTRAQLLTLLGLHKDMRNCLMMATDGVVTREKLVAPIPVNTGTAHTGKPLGGWERKGDDKDPKKYKERSYEKGMFLARPGIYFPMDPTQDQLDEIRARGVGRSVLVKSWSEICEAWNRSGIYGIARVPDVSRFCGAKTSISVSKDGYRRALANDGILPAYGSWIRRRVELGFNPKPKRENLNPDKVTLALRKFPNWLESVPYKRALHRHSPEAQELMAAKEELLEQPDADLLEYDLDNE